MGKSLIALLSVVATSLYGCSTSMSLCVDTNYCANDCSKKGYPFVFTSNCDALKGWKCGCAKTSCEDTNYCADECRKKGYPNVTLSNCDRLGGAWNCGCGKEDGKTLSGIGSVFR